MIYKRTRAISIWCSLLFALILFPWTSFGLNNFDSQPWSLPCSILILLGLRKVIKPNPYLVISFVITLVGFLWSLFVSTGNQFLIMRSLYNFTSFFTILYLSSMLAASCPRQISRIFVITNLIWIAGALIEAVAPSFISAFGNARTSLDRGLTSFAPEPTFFGLALLFYILILDALPEIRKNKKIHATLLIVNLLAILFLAKSSMVVLFICIGFGIFLLVYLLSGNLKNLLTLIILLISTYTVVFSLGAHSYLQNFRVGVLAQELMSKGVLDLLKSDASINERLQHVVYSLYGSYQNAFLPSGLDNFSLVWDRVSQEFQEYFWYGKPNDKIMSWIGEWVYSLGLFGILSLCILSRLLRGIDKNGTMRMSMLAMALVSAVPVANSFVPILLGIEAANIKRKLARWN